MRIAWLMLLGLTVLLACSTPVSQVIHKPVIHDISLSRTQIYVNEFITVQADVSDKDGDELKFTWESNGGSFTNPHNNPTQWHAGSKVGTFTITLKVSDGSFTVQDSRTVKVLAKP